VTVAKGDVKVSIIGDASSLVGALGKSSAASSAFGGVFAGVGMAVGQDLMGMASKVASFAGDSIQKFMDVAAQTRTLMRETGMTAQGASTLGAVAKASGVNIDDLTRSLKMLDKNLVAGKLDNYAGGMKGAAKGADELTDAQLKLGDANERVADLQVLQSQKTKHTYSDQIAMREALEDVTKAQEDLKTAQDAGNISLDKYGISVRDAKGELLPMWTILKNSANTFEKLGDGPEAVALSMKMFGKEGMAMLPFLQQGEKGLDGLAEAAQRTGLVLGDESMEKWKKARQASRELSIGWEGLQVQIGEFLVPALTSVSEWMGKELPKQIEIAKQWWADNQKKIGEWKATLVEAIDWAKTNIPLMIETIKSVGGGLAAVLDPIVGTIQTLTLELAKLDDKIKEMQGGNAKHGAPVWGLSDLGGGIGTIKKLQETINYLQNGPGGRPLTADEKKVYDSTKQAQTGYGNAGGGFLQDGWGWVGENGPELRYTRGGQTSVLPSTQSGGGVGGTPTILQDTYVINIDGNRMATAERRRELSLA
jgi:hypothetical protein